MMDSKGVSAQSFFSIRSLDSNLNIHNDQSLKELVQDFYNYTTNSGSDAEGLCNDESGKSDTIAENFQTDGGEVGLSILTSTVANAPNIGNSQQYHKPTSRNAKQRCIKLMLLKNGVTPMTKNRFTQQMAIQQNSFCSDKDFDVQVRKVTGKKEMIGLMNKRKCESKKAKEARLLEKHGDDSSSTEVRVEANQLSKYDDLIETYDPRSPHVAQDAAHEQVVCDPNIKTVIHSAQKSKLEFQKKLSAALRDKRYDKDLAMYWNGESRSDEDLARYKPQQVSSSLRFNTRIDAINLSPDRIKNSDPSTLTHQSTIVQEKQEDILALQKTKL